MIKAIPDIHHSIERPIVKSIVCDLVDNAILPVHEHFNYQPILNHRNTSGTTLKGEARKPFMFKSEGYLEARVSIAPVEGLNIPYPITHQNERVDPLFLDLELEVAIQPLYTHMEFNIEFTYHTASLEYINEWNNHIQTERMFGKDRLVHQVQYSYRLPKDTHTLLREIWERREAKAGYGDTLLEYLTKHTSTGMIKATGGGHQQMMITDIDMEVIGYHGEKVEVEESDDKYKGSISYKFYMSIPKAVQAIYPVQIHQSLLPLIYLPNTDPKYPKYGPARGFLLNRMGEKPDVFKPINLTRFDDSRISSPPHGYGAFWRALLTLDTGEPDEVLCSLYDLPGYCMPKWIFCFLKNFREESTVPYKQPFVFSLHRGDDLMAHDYLTLDSQMRLRTTKPLNLRHIWHISLSIATENVAVGLVDRVRMCDVCKVHKDDLYALSKLVRDHNVTTGSYRATDKMDLCNEPGANMFTVQSVCMEIFRQGVIKEETIRS